jgi:hypothetical protein
MKKPVLLGVLVLALASSVSRAQNSSLQYRGFNVDFARISTSANNNAIVNAVKEQIDIVAKVHLSKDDLDFFRTVPIVMVPDSSGTPGIYIRHKKTVFLKGRDLAPTRPILLHELLHAYHDQRLPQGMDNEQIRDFYQKAGKAFSEFQGNEYFLQNEKEFFAVTASIYLFGNIPRPPYTRKNIKEKMPLYFSYLATLFGPEK